MHSTSLDFQGAILIGADLSQALLRSADLRGADLRWANLRWDDLRSANLRKANLEGADLRWANLREANLRKANLEGADLEGAKNVLQIGPIGSRRDFLYVVFGEKTIIRAGCFWGTLDAFTDAVNKTHGSNAHGEQYRAVIALIKLMITEPITV